MNLLRELIKTTIIVITKLIYYIIKSITILIIDFIKHSIKVATDYMEVCKIFQINQEKASMVVNPKKDEELFEITLD